MSVKVDPILIMGIVKEAVGALQDDHPALSELLGGVHDELTTLADHINSLSHPLTDEFVEALKREQQFQRLDWGLEHDAGKSDDDWFWLIAVLMTKAKQTPADDPEKKRHRMITAAAAIMNWHAQELRDE